MGIAGVEAIENNLQGFVLGKWQAVIRRILDILLGPWGHWRCWLDAAAARAGVFLRRRKPQGGRQTAGCQMVVRRFLSAKETRQSLLHASQVRVFPCLSARLFPCEKGHRRCSGAGASCLGNNGKVGLEVNTGA